MSVEGYAAIAAIISALAAAGSTSYGIVSSQAAKRAPTPALPKTPVGDLAAAGLMKSEKMGGATPQWTQGLTGGGGTAPLPGAGGTTVRDLSGASDEAANVFGQFLGGG